MRTAGMCIPGRHPFHGDVRWTGPRQARSRRQTRTPMINPTHSFCSDAVRQSYGFQGDGVEAEGAERVGAYCFHRGPGRFGAISPHSGAGREWNSIAVSHSRSSCRQVRRPPDGGYGPVKRLARSVERSGEGCTDVETSPEIARKRRTGVRSVLPRMIGRLQSRLPIRRPGVMVREKPEAHMTALTRTEKPHRVRPRLWTDSRHVVVSSACFSPAGRKGHRPPS